MQTSKSNDRAAFTFPELLTILATLLILAGLCLPALARTRQGSHISIDLNNARQIMAAMALYASDNAGHVPHPTWGSDFTGPDGWAYATRNNGRIPGGPASPNSAAGRDVNSAVYSNQMLFFTIGQTAPYLLKNHKVMECPTDVGQRKQSRLKTQWIARSMKITSYKWSSVALDLNSQTQQTYRLDDFQAEHILLWEGDETSPFNFNDAASNAENPGELPSARHGLDRMISTPAPQRKGGALTGRFGGGADLVQLSQYRQWQADFGKTRQQNALLCGPSHRR